MTLARRSEVGCTGFFQIIMSSSAEVLELPGRVGLYPRSQFHIF